MAVKLNSSGGGSSTIDSAVTASNLTFTLPTASGTLVSTASTTGINGSAISSGTVAEAYGGTGTNTGYYGFKNRIINGAMMIDQRNAGASTAVSAGSTFYGTDRFAGFFGASATGCTTQQSSTAPTGFVNSLKFAVGTGASSSSGQSAWIGQRIEGLNVADLAWGTANAKTVTLSFYVYASTTGTYCVFLTNSAGDRSYVSTYTVSSANTWEQKTITIAGDTTGTWLTTNGIGVSVRWDLGSGSNYNTATTSAWQAGDYRNTSAQVNVIGTSSATFYITGVQLEKGSTATSFDYRPYGTELALCQRYYYKIQAGALADTLATSFNDTTTVAVATVYFPVTMRIAPTSFDQSGTASNYKVRYAGGSANCSSVPTTGNTCSTVAAIIFTVASGLTAGQGSIIQANSASSAYLGWSAEL